MNISDGSSSQSANLHVWVCKSTAGAVPTCVDAFPQAQQLLQAVRWQHGRGKLERAHGCGQHSLHDGRDVWVPDSMSQCISIIYMYIYILHVHICSIKRGTHGMTLPWAVVHGSNSDFGLRDAS